MKKVGPVLLFAGLIIVLLFSLMFDQPEKKVEADVQEVQARVLETDDSNLIQSGFTRIGGQSLLIEILEGSFKGQRIKASNDLLGKLDLDSYYQRGDKIVAALLVKDNQIRAAKAVELYRQDWELVLFAVFILCLLVYAQYIGFKALFSFVASLFVIWKILIPGLLAGQNPLLLATLVLTLLTAVIIFSVAGFSKKGVAAFTGTMCGLIVTIGFTIFFGEKLNMSGMTAPFAETLLYSGHLGLNMRQIFYAAIIIGASGAAMDIAMDVAASMGEIVAKKPDIKMKELVQSGFNVGRAVIGTMTTTLLLAYSGGYLTLLMLFMTKNSSIMRIVNLKIVAAEIMRTVVGSIGLVLVAPLTALVAGWIYCTVFPWEKTGELTTAEKEQKL